MDGCDFGRCETARDELGVQMRGVQFVRMPLRGV